ncbi:hypothetical protein ACFE04_004715 [Oxalis oulophora]
MGKELPAVIMSDIFCRLPVKSLLRFSCLSKQMYSKIQSPDFIKRQQTQSLKSNINNSLIITDVNVDAMMPALLFGLLDLQPTPANITSLHFDSMDCLVTLRNPLLRSKLVGACNGILCFHSYDGNVALFNFATRKHRIMPALHFDLVHTDYVVYGFGYDHTADDYIVVRLVQRSQARFIQEVTVYSLKANAWRKVTTKAAGMPFSIEDRRMGVYANGKLHFALVDKTGCSVVVAFDLGFDTYKLLPLPVAKEKSISLVLSLFNGWLCMCPVGSNSVWVMKEYGVKGSWTKIISFEGELAREFWCPVAYSLNGDKVLLQATHRNFYWYDLTNKDVEEIEMSVISPHLCFGVVVVDSLVSLKSNKKKVQDMQKMNLAQEANKPKKGAAKKKG